VKGLGYLCAVMLAAVFVRAGAAKLARPKETSAGFRALGVPKPDWLARLVPVVELVLAVTLMAAPRGGAIGSLLVLGVFTRFLGRALAAGSTAPCNCFGTAHADPISLADVVRNLVLGGLAAVAVSAPRPESPEILAVVMAVTLAGAGLLVMRWVGGAGRRSRGSG